MKFPWERFAAGEDLSPEAQEAENVQEAAQKPESQLLRTAAQGLTFRFADEVEAVIRSAFSDRKYDEVRDEIRQKLTDYKISNPKSALTAETVGAIIPSAIMIATGYGAPVGTANLKRTGANILGQSALTAVGEAEDLTDAAGIGASTGFGTAAGVVFEGAARGTGKLVSPLVNLVRKKFGDKADTAVQAELQRLVEATGLEVDEVIAGVADGSVIADNLTLVNAIKSMVNEGGDVAADIIARSGARKAATGQAAQQQLEGALAPQSSDPNVIRAFRESEARLKQQQSDAYSEAFEQAGDVPLELAEQMQNILQRVPQTRAGLEELYQAESIVPLFRTGDNGAITLARRPTVKDAELLRRTLMDIKSGKYKESQGTMGDVVGRMEKTLRGSIDEASPQVRTVRADYAARMSARDAFEEGRKALNKNVDELQIYVDSLNPQQLEAFRAGTMAAIRDRARRLRTTVRKLADEDTQIGAALRVVLPENQAQSVTGSLRRAADADIVAEKVQPTAGSPTAQLMREQELRGSRPSAEDSFRMTQGDPFAFIKTLKNAIPSGKGLDQSQMLEVVKILYSESPELVERALKDNTVQGELLRAAERIASALATTGRTATIQQSAQ